MAMLWFYFILALNKYIKTIKLIIFLPLFHIHYPLGWGGGVLPIMAYMGRLCLKGVPFLKLRGGISLVEVYKRLGKSVILISL